VAWVTPAVRARSRWESAFLSRRKRKRLSLSTPQ
jgi:hypothetical protein